MKTKLQDVCDNYDFQTLFERKGYVWFDRKPYNLNIIGVRSNNDNKVTNTFDDVLIVDYMTNTSQKRAIYPITTEPGLHYIKNTINPKGTAILVPGQYRSCWEIGWHQGKYKALVQKEPLPVYRDNNRDDIYDLDPNTIEKGVFGINIHRSSATLTSKNVDKWSAGCQVFANPTDFCAFMRLCEMQANLYGNSFTYTLLKEIELI